MKTMSKFFASLLLAGSLAACGGGGGDDGGGSSLSINATGSAPQATSVGAGQTASINVKSGDFITLQATEPVKWQALITSTKTTVTNQTLTDTVWSGNLISPDGDSIVLTAALASNPNKVFTLKLAVAASTRYSAIAPTIGEVSTFKETSVTIGGTSSVRNIAYTTSAVNNGVFTINAVNLADNSAFRNYTQDGNRNRLTQTYPATNNVCTYTPKRDLYNFPLYVGKTWNSTWQYACLVGGVPGYHENGSVVGNVEGIESVTTAAGTFNALRISYVISYANSSDPAGFTTYNETIKTWWSTELGRIVKWQDTYGYPTSFSDPTYLRTYTQELTSVK